MPRLTIELAYDPDDDLWVADVLELPGVIESDRDRNEAIRKAKELALKDMVLRAKFGLEPMNALFEVHAA